MKYRAFLSATLCASALVGCQTTGPGFDARAQDETDPPAPTKPDMLSITNNVDPRWLLMPTNPFTLGPGDRLDIQIAGEPASMSTTVVGPDGKLYYFLLPGLDVWGLTLGETKERLEARLKEYFAEQPQISLTLRGVESKRFWMLGRINSPGLYTLATPVTLLEALARGGGTAVPSPLAALVAEGGGAGTASTRPESADLEHSFIIRDGKMLPVNFQKLLRDGDLSQNIYLQPDDFIYLQAASSQGVHVLGAVAQPKVIKYSDRMTLVGAIAGANGTIKNAYVSHVAIVRGSLTEPKIAIVNFRDIVNARAPDVVLESQDIVYVPFTPYRTLTRYLDLIVNTFVRTVGANEGARAVSDSAAPVNVNVPINF